MDWLWHRSKLCEILLLLGHLLACLLPRGHGSSVYELFCNHSLDAKQLGFTLVLSLAAHEAEKGESRMTSLNSKEAYL